MIGLDLLGAGEGLATQTILLRVRSIDTEKLREKLKAGRWGALLAPSLAIVDQFPRKAIDLALPLARQQLQEIGVTADLAATDAPPPPRAPAETGVALAVGGVLGVLSTLLGRWVYARLVRRG